MLFLSLSISFCKVHKTLNFQLTEILKYIDVTIFLCTFVVVCNLMFNLLMLGENKKYLYV